MVTLWILEGACLGDWGVSGEVLGLKRMYFGFNS